MAFVQTDNQNLTKHMRNVVHSSVDKFPYAYCREELQELYSDMVSAAGSSAFASRRSALLRALAANGAKVSAQSADDELLLQVQNAPDRTACGNAVLREMQNIYHDFPTTTDHITRLVRYLADPDLLSGGSVRLTIVKQFLRYTDYHTRTVRRLAEELYGVSAKDTEAVIKCLDERIFDALAQLPLMDKTKRRDARRKYALLILADDLAFSRFRTNGKTREDLYMFAFAFQMRAYPDPSAAEYDPYRDVEKGLFRDYYQDNLLRYLSREYRENSKKYDAEPTGEGINYKNFAEIIYLYYLRKMRDPMDTRSIIKKANQLIEDCVRAAGTENTYSAEQEIGLLTDDYQMMFEDLIFHADEDALVSHLCRYFDIPADAQSRSRLSIHWEERSALNRYATFLEESACWGHTETNLRPTVFFDNPGIASEMFEEDFRLLLDKMQELLMLKIPSPTTVLASTLEQEQRTQCADRLLSVAAAMDCMEKKLESKMLSELTAQWSRLHKQLGELLKETIPDREERRTWNTVLDRGQNILYALRSACDRYKELLAKAQRLPAVLNKHTILLRETEHEDREILTVCGELSALSDKAEYLCAVLAQQCELIDAFEAQLREKHVPALKKWQQAYDACRFAQKLRELGAMFAHAKDEARTWESRCAALFRKTAEKWQLDAQICAQKEKYLSEKLSMERISRSRIIATCYHHFQLSGEGAHRSLPMLFASFRELADPILDACRYQKINEKNLFDVFAVYSLYFALNFEQ